VKIIEDLLSKLNYEAPVRDICQGPFQTAMLTRNCGLASTPHDYGPHYDKTPVKEASFLMEKDTITLAQMANSTSPFEAAIGMATINSLIEVDEQYCVELNGGDLVIGKGKDKKVAIIGHFPFVPKLREAARELWVIEQQPQPGDLEENQADRLIPMAEVIAITGNAFTNHSITHLLTLCRPEAYVVILGCTAPLSPVLFNYSVDAISGSRVTDSEMVLRYVSQGATFRQIKGVQRLTMTKEKDVTY